MPREAHPFSPVAEGRREKSTLYRFKRTERTVGAKWTYRFSEICNNGTEWTKQLIANDPKDLTSFELGLKAYGIEYQRIRVATPRHNGKVERQHRIDQARFYNDLRMFSLLDGQRQLAEYQRKSNDYIKGCLGMRSPNQMIELYLGVM